MQLVVATLTTEFIYTKYQTNLTNCYSTQTTILYNRNINRIVVTLASENNTQCAVFPQGVEAQLAFQTSGIPIQRIQVANFSYANTTELVFEGVPDIVSEEFVVLNVYSYGYITERSIFIFQEQKSSLTQCFEPSSTVNIHVDKLIVTMHSTKLCTNQFDTITDGETPPVTIGELTSATLNVQGSIFSLEVKTFQGDYKKGEKLTLEVPLTGPQSEQLLLIVAPNATVTFESLQGGAVVTFDHNIGEVTSTGIVVGTDTFWNPAQKPQLGLFQGIYMLRMQYSPNIEKLQPQIDKLKFDNIMYRISGLAPNASNAQQVTIQTTTFDRKIRFLSFTCDQGRQLERNLCMNFYNVANQMNVSTTIYLDLIFQLGSIYVHIEKSVVDIQNKMISSAIASLGHNQAKLQILSKIAIEIPPNTELKVKFTVLQNSNPADFDDPALSFEVQQTVSDVRELIRFTCDSKCKMLMKRLQVNHLAFYQLESNLLDGVIFANSIFDDDYLIMEGIIIGASLIVILVLVITSIIGMVLLMKQMKKQSKRKAKKL
ncbi:hypothetical protein SS50377_20663 [Spironucleus salmonicida]|uniref:Uncharacterized protein n=1 Tax=Spironucleus salmonicida TaxID=348837 RepID=V6LZ11_9EUKA|nr:hypothetical protein SS50377_20663 [Spironucleus salmonicida]|eukprot:EST49513.1 Hypothetical protein SS50377_10115 [Spironucleus salmonicida]